MADSQIRVGVAVEVDSGAARQVERRIGNIERGLEALDRSFKSGKISAEQYADGFEKLEKRGRTLNKVLDRLEEPREIDVRNDNFDRVSRDVGLAGDVQSNLGAIGGLAGAAGIPGAGAIGIGGEAFALIEELPRLKTAFAGMPQTIASAATALGTNSAGLIGSIGVLGVAAAGVAVAIGVAAESIDKTTASFGRAVDAAVEVERAANSGMSEGQVQDRIQSLQAEAAALRTVEQNTRAAAGALGRLANVPILNRLPGVGALRKELEDLDAQADAAEKEATAFNQALEQGRFVSDDVATEEAQLAQTRAQGAAQAGQVAAAEQSLFQSRLDAISSAGAGGSPVAGLSGLPRKISYKRSSGGGGSADSQRVNAAQEAAQRLVEIERDTARQRADIATQANDRIQDAEINARRAIDDIQRDADRNERDAARQRNFLAIADNQRTEREAIEDRKRDLKRQNEDILRETQRQYRDLVTQAQRQRQDLVQSQVNTYQDSLNATQQWGQQFTQIVGEVLQSTLNAGQQASRNSGRANYSTRAIYSS